MTQNFSRIHIRSGREFQIQKQHPWIFSGAIEKIEGVVHDGAIVEVLSATGERLGFGHYADSSIAIKLFLFGEADYSESLWRERLLDARAYRESLGLCNTPSTNAFRLVHAEGDRLPGLIVDRFADVAVVEFHSEGMRLLRAMWEDLIPEVYPMIQRVLFRDDLERVPTPERIGIIENGQHILVPLDGQKTGYFLDQAENRLVIRNFSKGKRVLDCFCYTGGFAVAALAGEATHVTCVDSSERALACAQANLEMNNPKNASTRFVKADCLQWLQAPDEQFDLIVLDPPAFVKSRKALSGGLRGYESINRQALQHLPSGGMLATFSCSQLVSEEQFTDIVRNAAARAGRFVRIVQRFGQAASHPGATAHPEGSYLKGLLLYVS